MVASVSSSNSAVSNWADSIYAKLDTKNQGYIEKTDLQDALSKAGATSNGNGSGGQSVNVDDTFSALDGDSDGKVTKSELTEAMSKLSDHLNAQFDASRVGRGGGDGDGDGGGGSSTDATSGTSGASGTDSTSADYIAAADTDGDGTVSDAEQAAYEKKVASGQADSGNSSSSGAAQQATHQKDPMRELAHALHLLKAYAENSGSDASTGDAGTSSTTSVSVEA
jgi:Ca2+-binding EF-hand superfamily protein